MKTIETLPFPSFYNPKKCCDGPDGLWYVDYGAVQQEAFAFKKKYNVTNAATDQFKMVVVPIDMQLTFAAMKGGLPVAGAFQDCIRTVEWAYKHMRYITRWIPTLDTHMVMQIFNSFFLIDENNNTLAPYTMPTIDQIRQGKIRVNPAVAWNIAQGRYPYLEQYLPHYVEALKAAKTSIGGKLDLTVWPYHAQLGGIEHALLPTLHEMMFFHTIVRASERVSQIKGGNPLSENYGPLVQEVTVDHLGRQIGQMNSSFFTTLVESDATVVLGQAKSHCVTTFIDQLLSMILKIDPSLARKVYLMEDCTSPVVVPGVVDYTIPANEAFKKFAAAGMHIVNTKMKLEDWPELGLVM